MSRITNYNFTIERQDNFIIIKYDTSQKHIFNISSILTYHIINSTDIQLVATSNDKIVTFDYTKCTNIITDTQEEFITILRKLIHNVDIPYEVRLALGHISDAYPHLAYGFSDSIGTTSSKTIWCCDHDLDFITGITGENVTITSTSEADILGSTGASHLYIDGLTNNDNVITEVIALSGTNPVTTINPFTFINRAIVAVSGSNRYNVGKIMCKTKDTEKMISVISENTGTTQKLIYKIPKDKKGYVKGGDFTVFTSSENPNPKVDVELIFHYNNGVSIKTFIDHINCNVNNHLTIKADVNHILGESTIIEVKAKSDVNNTKISGKLFIVIQNKYD